MFEIPADVLLCCCDGECERLGDCCSDYASCCAVGSSTSTTTATAAFGRERDDGEGGGDGDDEGGDGCDGMRPGLDVSVRGGDGALLLTRRVARRAVGGGGGGGDEGEGDDEGGTPSAGAFRDACVKAFADDDVRAALRRFNAKRINE